MADKIIDNELNETVNSLTDTNKKLVSLNEKLIAENTALNSVCKLLQAEIVASSDKKGIVVPKISPINLIGKSFTVEGKEYRIAYPKVTLNDGRAIDASIILADKDLQAELVANKHSIITEKL